MMDVNWDTASRGAEGARKLFDTIRPTLEAMAARPLGRVALAAMTIVSFLSIYSYVNATMVPRVDFYTPLDAVIPFMPWTIFIYLSMYLLFAVASVYIEGLDFLKGLATLVLVCVISLLFFIAVPAHYPRPDPMTIESSHLSWMYATMFAFDDPGNTFPSLHVGTTTTAALMLKDTRLKWFFGIWAVLICISTLTVKQHFIADVFGGAILAVVVFSWARRNLFQ